MTTLALTFLSSARLWLLVVPVALLVAYVVVARQRKKYVVRFTSVDLLASVAPRRPGWQRHVAGLVLLGAVVLLVLGFARPARGRVALQRGTVMLALDTSNSMGATDVSPSRLAAAQQSARDFVDGLPSGLQIGLLSFDRTARILVAPTSDHAAVHAGIDRLELGPGTATGDALYLALNAISALPVAADGKPAPAIVVLMSDGTPTVGRGGLSPEATVNDASGAAKAATVAVDTIAFGTPDGSVTIEGKTIPVPADPSAMQQIADATGGTSFTAQSGGQLSAVYDQIGRAVGYDTTTHEVTAWFTGAGLLLVVLAAGAALVWTQRLL